MSLRAYLAIGGLPPKPLGEDAALTFALECAGFRVRHAMDVCVTTSCRFDGRAKGGAADTMRHRHAVLEAPCDEDIEPAFSLVRRALYKGKLRSLYEAQGLASGKWATRLNMPVEALCFGPDESFEHLWLRLSSESPVLRQRRMLRPADLSHEIERALLVLRTMRTGGVRSGADDRADKPDHSESRVSAAA